MVIDWQQVVLNLRKAGLPCSAVARRIGRDPCVIQRLARGEKNEPLWSVGMALLDLHLDFCRDAHAKMMGGERG